MWRMRGKMEGRHRGEERRIGKSGKTEQGEGEEGRKGRWEEEGRQGKWRRGHKK